MNYKPNTLPGFTAETSLYQRGGRYRSVTTRAGGAGEQRILSQLRRGSGGVGGGGGFACKGGKCRCDGDPDCNDMFSTNVCDGKSQICTLGWLTGEWYCECK